MSKAGNVFRGFFKLIFTIAALVLAVLAIVLFTQPFYGAETTTSLLTFKLYASGFTLAFGGELTAELVGILESSSSVTFDTVSVDINIPILIAFVLFVIGALLLLCNLFTWKPGKSVAAFGGLLIIVAAILVFCAVPLGGMTTVSSTEATLGDLYDDSASLGWGAIVSGICGIASGACGLIASLFKTKGQK